MKNLNINKNLIIWKTLTLTSLTLLMSACGKQTVSPAAGPTNALGGFTNGTQNSSASTVSPVSPGSPSSSTGTAGTLSPTPDTLANAYDQNYSFNVTGANTYTTPDIITDNVLQVTVTSGSPGLVSGTGYLGNYSCLKMRVWAGNQSQEVYVSYGTPHPATPCGVKRSLNSASLDFRSVVTQIGHGPVRIRISDVWSDNCRTTQQYNPQMGWVGGPTYAGCAMSPLYSSYSATGQLKITVNQPQN